MTDEQSGAEPDHVIPPPPVDAGGRPPSFPPVVPLAPPVSAPAPPAPAAGALPPYAAATPPAPRAGGYPASVPAAAYPAPAPAKSSNTLGVVLAVVGGLVIFAVVGVVVLVGLLVRGPEEASPPAPGPSPSAFAEDPDAPADEQPSDGDEPADPETDPSGIAERLEAKIDEYKRLRDSGALWQTIPDNEYNRTAVSAYLYLMTDMKVATIWGIDAEQAQEYDERMTMLEEKLLAQEPLGDDIKLTLEDKVFTYDGETGEGGYTDK
ncbi:hypothetical protein [Microbacterium sp. EST19A]|uniref:hypothetical protein n=1 Tax=Microbacterium sp. EST19A TaxID=2862681 RepID=UPI001CBEF95C|nr:hypothetical protein [Microbacterium sp. EST19A]